MAIPANPSTARGYSCNVVLDEFAYHEKPDAVWSAMFPSQTNPLANTFLARVKAMREGRDFESIQRTMKLRVVSTFNGQDNRFYRMWERRAETGYSGHMITIHEAVEQGLKTNIEELRAALDDPEIWAQEFECVPADVSAVLLPYDLLASCESPEATTTIGPDYFTSGKAYVMGIDYGRKRDMSVAWTDEIMGDVAHCREVLEMRNMSTPDQIELLRPRIRNARRVCLDYSSPGLGLGDFLVKEFGEYNPAKHQFGKIELCTFTNPLKLEIFSKLRMAFEQRRARIPVSRAVREDLHSVQRMTTVSGNITYRAPHTEDGHADRCTAKALAHRAMGCARQPVAFSRIQTEGPTRDEIYRFFGGTGGGSAGPAYGAKPSNIAEWEWAEEQARKKGRGIW
jgi:phage FluMu gp28-like protein